MQVLWADYFGKSILTAAQDLLSNPSLNVPARVLDSLRVARVVAAAGVVILQGCTEIAVERDQTDQATSAVFVASCPCMMHGRNPNLSCMMPPEAAQIAHNMGLSRFCPDSRISGCLDPPADHAMPPGGEKGTLRQLRSDMNSALLALYSEDNLKNAIVAIRDKLNGIQSGLGSAWVSQEDGISIKTDAFRSIRPACKAALHAVGLPLRSIGLMLRIH